MRRCYSRIVLKRSVNEKTPNMLYVTYTCVRAIRQCVYFRFVSGFRGPMNCQGGSTNRLIAFPLSIPSYYMYTWNYLPYKSRIPIRGAENISKSRRNEGKGITLVLSVMAVDGVIYAARLDRRFAQHGGGRSTEGWRRMAWWRGGATKGTVGQVAREKNIHARGDAEFSFSRR